MDLHSAKYWSKDESRGSVICRLCPHNCRIPDGGRGLCRVRKNIGGELLTSSFGEVVSLAIDPIEKKPLYHFYPGATILSTGPRGCNFSCRFCQNWSISQCDGPTTSVSSEELVELAIRKGSIGIAYTYTEPIVAFEFVMETAELARRSGLLNIMVTNGFINSEPLDDLLGVIDAMNVDLKSMDDDFYRKICGGRLEPVIEALQRVAASNTHLEITNLIIPEYNDPTVGLHDLVDFVASLSVSIPVHFSGYYPAYKLNAPPTDVSVLREAFDIASKKLDYVYIGNRATDWGNETFCPDCGNELISRHGFSAKIVGISEDGKCNKCGRKADIVGPWNG